MKTSLTNNAKKRQRGLVEFLVVIAIIAIVVGMLLPALCRPKRRREAPRNLSSLQGTNTQQAQLTNTNRTAKSGDSRLGQEVLLLTIGAACFVGVAFGHKRLLTHLNRRGRLAILEVLSDGHPRRRPELVRLAKKMFMEVRLIPGSVADALSSLVEDGKIRVQNGEYTIICDSADDAVSSTQTSGQPGEDGVNELVIVDDDQPYADSLRALLHIEFKDVFVTVLRTVRGFLDVFDRIATSPPILIVLDIMLPYDERPDSADKSLADYRSGLRCLEMLSGNPHTCTIPILIISAVDERQILTEGAQLPPNVIYLRKPVNTRQIIECIRSLSFGRMQAMRAGPFKKMVNGTEIKPGWFGITFDVKKMMGK